MRDSTALAAVADSVSATATATTTTTTTSDEAVVVSGVAVSDVVVSDVADSDVAGSRRPPVVSLTTSGLGELDATTLAVVVGVSEGSPKPSEAVEAACAGVGVDVSLLLAVEEAKADAGSAVVVPLARAELPTRLVVVGVGEGRAADWRAAGATAARRSTGRRVAVVGVASGSLANDGGSAGSTAPSTAEAARAFAVGAALAAYRQPTTFVAPPAGGHTTIGVDAVAEVDGDVDVEMDVDGDHAVTEAEFAEAVQAVAAAAADAAGSADAAGKGGGSKGGLRELVLLTTAAAAGAGGDSAGGGDSGTGGGGGAGGGDNGAAASSELVAALGAADVVARAVYLARDLINTPASVATPAALAARAVELGAEAGFGVKVLGPDELAEGGFGGLLAVGQGAVNPPRLVQLSYVGPAPADGSDPGHRVLVGKGITFDTGGLSLKPTSSMVGMKTDMSGSAAVLATMTTLAGLGAPGRVTGLMCLAENAFGGAAMRPGDVISCYGGTTVEVLNTDAEGRLVLADGLAYAAANLAPDVMVDLATLTGAISVALGRRTAGLFASDDELAEALSAASERAGERVWRLPLVDEYRPAIVSPVADLANIGRYLDVSGGSITAALFLREFAGGVPWAHLDIAGTARSDSDDGEISRGGTGWGVRTLVSWLTGS